MMNTKQCTLPRRGVLRIALALLMIGSTAESILAQTGYIYLHSKALNETGSPDINITVSGGSTPVPAFTLNDDPTQNSVSQDIGASENGRLWAATNSGVLYYRDANSTTWVQTGITGVARVDGGPGGTCYFIDSAGTVYSYDGVSPEVQISLTAQFSNSGGWNDIGSGWTGTPTSSFVNGPAVYIVRDNSAIYKWSGSGTAWNIYANISGTAQYRIDVNPTNGNVYVGGNAGSVRTIREITPAAAPVVNSLGSPVSDYAAYKDIAVTQNGEVYTVATDVVNSPTGAYVHKFLSGTTWSKETGSFDAFKITGGPSNLLWSTMASGGWGVTGSWAPSSGPYPFYNIFTRAFDGTNPIYIDDERVRTTIGNSQLIPVVPGTYTISESAIAGWDLQKILIYDPTANSTSNQATGTATVDVAAGEVVHVVYQNGELNPFNMTSDCANAYLETFGVGTAVGTATTSGSFGLPVAGQTSYHYLTGNAPGEDGYYKIVNRANPDFNTWSGAAGIVDHTPGDGDLGYMYAVNAGFDKGEFFRRRFTGVIAGANYSFSAWIVNLTAAAQVNPNVSFTVFDHNTQTVLGTYSTGELTNDAVPGTWQKFGFDFTGTSSDIDLVISNNGLGGNGNDLAIDDISFSLSPPTPTVVLQNSDCAGGLGSITITAPIGAYEYSIDGTNWQASPVFANVAPGTYTASVRFTGTANCTNSSTQAIVLAAICGNVFHDANGLTDNSVNGTGIGQVSATQLYVSLYNGSTLVSTVPVDADGTYSFADVTPNTTYTAVLGTNPAGNTTSVFQGGGSNGWIATGEDCCDNTGGDGAPDGGIAIVVGNSNVNNANFGIQQLPDSDPKSTQIFQPYAGQLITMNGGSNPPVLSGSDPEDMPAGGVLTGKTVTITTVPTNSELYYDNVLVTSGLTIPGFDPSKLQVKFTAATLGDTTTQFEYAYVDLSGAVDPTPAVYELKWEDPMPVTLVSFEIARSESAVLISWATTSETNSSHFDIERSLDARHWEAVGKVAAAESSNKRTTYEFTDRQASYGTVYYRLKMVDLDETFAYSQIRSMSIGHVKLNLYPNPVGRTLRIDDVNAANIRKVVVYSNSGVIVYSKAGANPSEIDLSGLRAGSYVVTLIYNDGSQASRTINKN